MYIYIYSRTHVIHSYWSFNVPLRLDLQASEPGGYFGRSTQSTRQWGFSSFPLPESEPYFQAKNHAIMYQRLQVFCFFFLVSFMFFFLHGTIGTMVQVCPSFKIHSSTCTAGPLRFSSRRRWWGKLSARDARNFREDQGEVSWTNGA